MTSSQAERVYDHYARFLGKPVARNVYRAAGIAGSIQVLQFDGVFSGCTTMATLGIGRMTAAYTGDFVEVVMVVDDVAEDAERCLINTLFGVVEHGFPISEGTSVGGPVGMQEAAIADTGKVAFYFAEPMPFPSEFRAPDPEITIVLAIPIAAAEHEFVKRYGGEAFEERLEANNVDPFRIRRPSVC